jgi:hypothetical protein
MKKLEVGIISKGKMNYNEWVRYFLNNGALIDLAENMAKVRIDEVKEMEKE